MIYQFGTARLILQINFPKILKDQVSTLTSPFESRNKSRFRFSLILNDSGSKLGRLTTKQARERAISIINITKESSTVEIRYQAIEAVSAAIGFFLVLALAGNQGLLLHAACFKHNGLAYIFLGKSGAGKSTIVRNASGVEVVHDDRVAVRKIKDRWWAFGVPLCDNTANTGKNIEAPLDGVYLADKSDHLLISRLGVKSSLRSVAEHVILPVKNERVTYAVVQTLMSFVSENRCCRLRFGKWSDVVDII